MSDKKNIIGYALYVITFVIVVGLSVVSVNTENNLMKFGEKIIRMVYEYNDINVVLSNSERLVDYCEPDVLGILDNRNKPIFMRRFKRYTPTKPLIMKMWVDRGKVDTVHAIVEFNVESALEPRLISIGIRDGLVCEYNEYVMLNNMLPITDSLYEYDGTKDWITSEDDIKLDSGE